MNYQEARQFMRDVNEKSGSILGLERIEKLMDWLDHPEEELKIIHVAGTNGKGSFGAFLEAIMIKAGYRVGRFISPAVTDERETIQINGEWISEQDTARILTDIRAVCEDQCVCDKDYPTAYELETAMAFSYFAMQQVDVVILEVGLGGLHDSTNVVRHPYLSVITSISYDHVAFLGNTLDAIAAQKAGIIKPGVPVLVYDQCEAVQNVLRAKAEENRAEYIATDFSTIVVRQQELEGQTFDYLGFKNLRMQMAGGYQLYNGALAISAADCLRRLYPESFSMTDAHIYEGIEAAKWAGRFEKIWDDPIIIVDGAHNPDGARVLAESIRPLAETYEILLVAAIFKDKVYDEILATLSDISAHIYVHKPPTARGLESRILAETAGKYFDEVTTCECVDQAMTLAVKQAELIKSQGKPALILSFGSLSTIAGVKNWLRNEFCVL